MPICCGVKGDMVQCAWVEAKEHEMNVAKYFYRGWSSITSEMEMDKAHEILFVSMSGDL